MVGLSYLPWVRRTQRPPRMSMAGITSTLKCRLAVVRELERDRDVRRVEKGLDSLLGRVLVLANDAQLVALDPDLQLVGNVLDPLAQVARELVVDARIESDVDLAATLADSLWIARLEELRRKLPARGLLAQHLESGPGPVLARRLDLDHLALMVVARRGVFEVEAGRDFPPGLIDCVRQLCGIELGNDVEGVLSHRCACSR